MNPPPPYPEGMPGWEKHTAAFTHVLLYALMPLSGWLMAPANPPAGSAGQKAQIKRATARLGMRGFAPASLFAELRYPLLRAML